MSDHNEFDKNRPYEPNADELANKPSEPTTYYRYGSFQSSNMESRLDNEQLASISDSDVEITEPERVRPIVFEREADAASITGSPATIAASSAQSGASQAKTKKSKGSSSWKSMFAAFMAGVVVVGGLMFTADKTNLFTSGSDVPAAVSQNSGPAQTVSASSGGGGSSVQNSVLGIERPGNIAAIVEQSRPAVVKIETYAKVSSGRQNGSNYNDFFDFFFNNGGRGQQDNSQGQQSSQETKVGEGSGFIFDSEGYILTNQHVVDGAETIKVYLEGYDEPFNATMLGESEDLDLAALKIDGNTEFASLKLGNVDDLRVGDWVIAIGNPYGYDHTVTVGVLSAKERPITIQDGSTRRQYEHLLQTDASINPGNSGGPLLNLNGEVIGINTAVNAAAQGIGFAIPTSTISEVLDNLKNDEPIPQEPAPYVGIYLGELNDRIAEQLGYSGTEGAIVTQVEVDGPASRAGVQAGDIITEVAGKKISAYVDVSETVKKQAVGTKITMKVFRDGKTYEVAIIVGDRNATE